MGIYRIYDSNVMISLFGNFLILLIYNCVNLYLDDRVICYVIKFDWFHEIIVIIHKINFHIRLH